MTSIGPAYHASHTTAWAASSFGLDAVHRLWGPFMRTLILVVLLASGPTTAAEMFKCTNAGGKIEYRDHPCDGSSGEKIKAKDNSVGTGDSLGAIRARDAQFQARQNAKREAEDRAAADRAAANERAFQEQRAHQDRQELTNAIREGNNRRAADNYNNNYNNNYNSNLNRQPAPKAKAEVAPAPSKGSSIAPARCNPDQGKGTPSMVCANR